jgi:hypothetical protein
MSLQAKLNAFKADLEARVPIDNTGLEQDGAFVREFWARVGSRWAPTILAGLAGRRMAVLAGVLAISATATTANAFEAGYPGYEQMPGFFLGVTAAPAAPGWYGVDRVTTYQAQLVGPGAPVNANGANNTRVKVDSVSQTILWASGWNFLGGAYEAAAIVPLSSANIGAPLNADRVGVHNALFVNQLAWKLGDSGFFLKTALLTWAPTGSQEGPSGLGSVGNPWWTFQPAVLLSYLKDGWGVTINVSDEIHTANAITNYRSGEDLHVDFTWTKAFGKWSVGPVAYYAGQITSDRSSAFYRGAINVNRYDIGAVGGIVGYNFGSVSLNVWALDAFSSTASGGTPGRGLADTATFTKGVSVFAALSYPLGGQDTPASPTAVPRFHK